MATPTTPAGTTPANELLAALAVTLKTGTPAGGQMTTDQVAQALISQIPFISKLAAEGRFNEAQLVQIKNFLRVYNQQKPSTSGSQTPTSLKRKSPGSEPGGPNTAADSPKPTNPGSQSWPSGQRSNASLSGTPSQLSKLPDFTADVREGLRKNSANDPAIRRTIQDLVSSIDPNYKAETAVEDLLLDIADEFIDSVTNFGCRLAKHRGGDKLEIRDLQLHLEKNHNIRIPGFAADMFAQPVQPPPAPVPTAPTPSTSMTPGSSRKPAQAPTKRSARLAAVQAAKRDGR